MPAWLHVLGLSALALFFAASLVLLGTVLGGRSPWLVVLLMFYFLALAKVAEPLVVLRMPRALEARRRWEREGRLLRRLGVLGFGRLLRRTPLRHLNARVYLARGAADPSRVRRQAASAEACHFWAAVLLVPFMALAAAHRQWQAVAWFSLTQVLVNVYPILHLRHVRARLDRMLERSGGTAASGGGPG